MHGTSAFLTNLAMVLGVAGLTTLVLQRLRLPVVFGYLMAGLIIGPHVPVPLVADPTMVRTLSELGVILLMFSLGLDFNLRRLVRVGPASALVALLEISFMFWLGFTAGRLLGWPALESLYAGAMIAVSSTTIILKAFGEQRVRGSLTDVAFGILIVEDLIVIVLLAVLTAVSTGAELSAARLAVTVGRLAAFALGLLALGMLVVPRLVRVAVRLGRPETILVTSVGLCFASALLAQAVGYSVALGAFIAGALVAESGEDRVVAHLIEPVRDMFAAIFFVAVGMLIDPALLARHAGAVLLFTVLVVAGKVGAVSVSAFLTGHGTHTSVQAAMSMGQIGEFSFILAGVGLATGATREFLYPLAVAVSAITTLLTPWLIRAADPLASAVDRHLPRPLQTFVALYGSWIEQLRSRPSLPTERVRARRAIRVLLVDVLLLAMVGIGTALEGGPLERWLAGVTGMPTPAARASVLAAAALIVTPFAVGILRTSRYLCQSLAALAFPPPEPGRLDLAAAPRRVLIATLQVALVLLIGTPLLALTQPFVPSPAGLALLATLLVLLGYAFWRSAANLQGHARAGAEVIVATLAKHARDARPGADVEALERAYQLLPGLGAPFPVRLERHSPAIGRRLAELELRGRSGATVLAILRGKDVVLLPDGHEILREGDVLALAGTHEAVEAAKVLLEMTARQRRHAPGVGVP